MNRNLLALLLLSIVAFGLSRVGFANKPPFPWPPMPNAPYPNVPFIKPDGSVLKMSQLKGRYVVIHYRGTTCPACKAMAERRELMWKDPRVVNVDVLLFNDQMQPPSAADAAAWAKRYGFREDQGEIVVAGPAWSHAPDLYQTTYKMVVGGQLIDKDGIVRQSVITPPGAKLPLEYWPALSAQMNQWLGRK